MSLINEALKKAQRQHGNVPPSAPSVVPGGTVAPPPPVQPVHPLPQLRTRRSAMPAAQRNLLIYGGVALLVLSVSVLAVVFWPKGKTPVVTSTPSTPVVVTSAPPPAVSLPTPAPAVSFPTPVVALPSPSPAATPVITPPAPVTPVAVVPAPSPPVANTSTTTPPGPLKPDPRIYELIDALRVTGVRISETDPKVLMSDRVYKPGDVVDRANGLRLMKITATRLTFTDANGFDYDKDF